VRETYSQVVVDYLLTGSEDLAEESAWWEIFALAGSKAAVQQAWEALREDLLAEFIRANPGRRPWGWWEFDAPRWGRKFNAYYDGTLPEPRLRLGGTGTPAYEALAYVPSFTRGIPDSWVKAWDVEFYNGRAKDIHGEPIGTKYMEGHFPYKAIDPDDPPIFESQASYLKRNGLLSPAEAKRIPAEAWEPEAIRSREKTPRPVSAENAKEEPC
jgi:hypothetical protein